MTPTIDSTDTLSAPPVAFPETLDEVRAYVTTLYPDTTIGMGSPFNCLGARLLAHANAARIEREHLRAYWVITNGSLDHVGHSDLDEHISILGTPMGRFFAWLFDHGLVRRRDDNQIAPGHSPVEEYGVYDETSWVTPAELLTIIDYYRTQVLVEDPTNAHA